MSNLNLHGKVSDQERVILNAFNNFIYFGKKFLYQDFNKTETPLFHHKVGNELIKMSPAKGELLKPMALIVARDHAKSLRLDQDILTAKGWKKVEDLTTDDLIYGSDGTEKDILGFSDIEEKRMYKVTTRDNRSLIVSEDHLWTVRLLSGSKKNNKYRDYTTLQLLANEYKRKRIEKRHGGYEYDEYVFAIDNPQAIEYPYKELELDPYTLGVLIGDGSLSGTPRVTSDRKDIDEIISYIPYKTYKYYPKDRTPFFNIHDIKHKIRKLGLLGKISSNKFIPTEYLFSNKVQRLELLKGLMDTDGTNPTKSSGGKKVSFCTISNRLADDVVELVRSLGGSANKIFSKNEYSGYYRVQIKININPFKLHRKAKRFMPNTKMYNTIVDIQYMGISKCKCLKVDSEDELFVAKDYLLTHNTTLVKGSIIRDFCFSKKAADWGLDFEYDPLFYGWVSSNQKKSKSNVSYVRMHLAHNPVIKHFFGDMKGNVWNQEEITTANECKLISSSNLSSMRGDTQANLMSGAERYTKVFVDDAENEENTKTERSRQQIEDNILNGILPAIDPTRRMSRLYFIGTPVHFDSMAQRFINTDARLKKDGDDAREDYPWEIIVYGCTQPSMPGGVLWDSRLSRPVLNQRKRQFEASKKGIRGYFQEYELIVQSKEDSEWTEEHIHYWEGEYYYEGGISYIKTKDEIIPVLVYVGMDYASDIATKASDYAVIMAIAIDAKGRRFVLEYIAKKNLSSVALRDRDGNRTSKKGVADYVVEYYIKYHARRFSSEDNAMNRAVFKSIKQVATLEGINIPIKRIEHKGVSKLERIYEELDPLFTDHKVYIKESHLTLQEQIITFGEQMVNDDVIDCFYTTSHKASKFSGSVNINKESQFYQKNQQSILDAVVITRPKNKFLSRRKSWKAL